MTDNKHPVAKFARTELAGVSATAPLPTEFKLFSFGVNHTLHGDFIFDAQSAADIMAEYKRRGVDLVVDLNHDSLDRDKRLMRADSADAMGWFVPEVRPDGLYAAQVRWSAEGERRLRARLQRYTSPAAHYDTNTGRVVSLVNCAICADPATHDIAPLVAASARAKTTMVGARVPGQMKRKLQLVAERRGMNVSGLIKLAVARMTAKISGPPTELLTDLLAAMGLPPTASPDDIKKALFDLVDEQVQTAPPKAKTFGECLEDPTISLSASVEQRAAHYIAEAQKRKASLENQKVLREVFADAHEMAASAPVLTLSAEDAPRVVEYFSAHPNEEMSKAQAEGLLELAAQGRWSPSDAKQHIVLAAARRIARAPAPGAVAVAFAVDQYAGYFPGARATLTAASKRR